MHFLLVIDNLRIGGIQRLALDEAYYFASVSTPSTIIVLSDEDPFNQQLANTEKVSTKVKRERLEDEYAKLNQILDENSCIACEG